MQEGTGWFQTITLALVVVGWFVINRQNNQREARKEIRAAIDALAKDLLEIDKQATHYWTAEGVAGTATASAVESEMRLKSFLERFEVALNRTLRRMRLETSPFPRSSRIAIDVGVTKAFEHFDMWTGSITGGQFETASRQPRSHADPMLHEMTARGYRLLDAIESVFDTYCRR